MQKIAMLVIHKSAPLRAITDYRGQNPWTREIDFGESDVSVLVALADTACGYGSILSLPDDATGFTTIELKTNFLGTAVEGMLACESTLVHGGRTTQVWDATVTNEAGKKLALFRCTQLLLY